MGIVGQINICVNLLEKCGLLMFQHPNKLSYDSTESFYCKSDKEWC